MTDLAVCLQVKVFVPTSYHSLIPSHSAVFEGFENTTTRTVVETTIVGGPVALRCDFQAVNPPLTVQWYANNALLNEVAGEVLFLDGGRYLYIQELTVDQREMRYHCEVLNKFLRARRSPTTYVLTGNIFIRGGVGGNGKF